MVKFHRLTLVRQKVKALARIGKQMKMTIYSSLDAKSATFEQIDDYAEALGLSAWINNH